MVILDAALLSGDRIAVFTSDDDLTWSIIPKAVTDLCLNGILWQNVFVNFQIVHVEGDLASFAIGRVTPYVQILFVRGHSAPFERLETVQIAIYE